MATVRLYATESAVFKNPSDAGNFSSATVTATASDGTSIRLLCKIPALADEYKFRKIISAKAGFYIGITTTTRRVVGFYIYALKNPYDQSTASYNAETQAFASTTIPSVTVDASTPMSPKYIEGSGTGATGAKRALENGLIFWTTEAVATTTRTVTTANASSNKPYLELTLSDDDAYITPKSPSPSSGYVDEKEAKQFTWGLTKSTTDTVVDIAVGASAQFQWRVNASGTINTINADTLQSVIVPANTFPSTGTFQWRVKITAGSGVEKFSDWKTLTTSEPLTTTTADAPKNEIISSSDNITFRWTCISSAGSAQTAADLQYYSNGVWTTFTSVEGAENEATVPASTFGSGEIKWRARTYNGDELAGEWSEAATFVLIGAPATPSVSVTTVPFATISWQSADQQAYKITVDGVTVKEAFGTEKTFTLPEPLPDGEHTVGVTVQGRYGFSSEEALASFNIENSPVGTMMLSAESGTDVVLAWEASASGSGFLVYRDEKLIGKTTETAFADKLTNGQHSYYVINRLGNGNYTKSNTASGTAETEKPVICSFPSGDWIEMALSERSDRAQTFSHSKTATLRHVMGAVFPVLEMSEFEDLTASYDVAFADRAAAVEFEKLKGKVVLVKSPNAEPVIGAMLSLEKTVGDFYTAYTFTLQKIHWEEIIDETFG